MNWQEHIVSNNPVLLGKPTIKGTRISVEFILERLAINALRRVIYFRIQNFQPEEPAEILLHLLSSQDIEFAGFSRLSAKKTSAKEDYDCKIKRQY